MKTLIIILSMAALLNEAGVCSPTDGYTSHLQRLNVNYTWDINADRFASTPAWNPEAQAIPLSLDKACKLGRGWLDQHSFTKFGLDQALLESYPDLQIAAMSHREDQRRFYYWLVYRSKEIDGSFMYVYVLMDGTVVEPTLAPITKQK